MSCQGERVAGKRRIVSPAPSHFGTINRPKMIAMEMGEWIENNTVLYKDLVYLSNLSLFSFLVSIDNQKLPYLGLESQLS